MKTLLFALCILSAWATAGEYKPLKGSYSIGGKTFYDPPAEETKKTHVYFALEGKTARDVYESMDTKAVRDECAGDSSMTKRIEEMQCTRSSGGKEYRCWFGIDLKNQKVVGGVVC